KRNCDSAEANTADLSVEIRTVSGNPALPTSTVLATATVPGASVPAPPNLGWVTVHFASPAPVSAGTKYVLVAASQGGCIVSLSPLVISPEYAWGLDSHDSYAGGTRLTSGDAGASWSSEAGSDLAFKTYVDSAPTANAGPDQTVNGGSLVTL